MTRESPTGLAKAGLFNGSTCRVDVRIRRLNVCSGVQRTVPFLRAYTVFCVDQIENLPDHYYGRPAPSIAPAQRIACGRLLR